MDHMLRPNLSLITVHFQTTFPFQHALVTDQASDLYSFSMQTGEQSFVFPLYIYSNGFEGLAKTVNLDEKLANKLLEPAGLTLRQKGAEPEDVFAYIYAVLYSPRYRSKYRELLKIDFPRIRSPKDLNEYELLVALGKRLIHCHLFIDLPKDDNLTIKITDSVVAKYEYKEGAIYINKHSAFIGVDESIWNMYIGGYQPLQKWLKERKKMALLPEDIQHFADMITAMKVTKQLMDEIDSSISV